VRILYLLMLLLLASFILLVVIYTFNHAMSKVEESADTMIRTAESAGITVDVSKIDIKPALTPFIQGLNLALILAFLAAVTAAFLYARRRE